MGAVGLGSLAALGGVLGVAAVAPTLEKQKAQWVDLAPMKDVPDGKVTTVAVGYTRTRAFFEEKVHTTVLVRNEGGGKLTCFSNACPHLGCAVAWDELTGRFNHLLTLVASWLVVAFHRKCADFF